MCMLSRFSRVRLCDLMDHSPARPVCPWDFPGKNTEVGCHALLQGVFSTQGFQPSSLTSPALAGGFFTTHTAT